MNHHQSLLAKDTGFGKGVFTSSDLRPGTFLIEMTGPKLRPHEIPPLAEREIMDHYIQCADDMFLGPSGNLDDLFNHSCEPNAGLFFTKNTILVKAIKRIPANAQIYIDYSTVITIDPLVMKCFCQTKTCRGEVRDFRLLPSHVRSQYIALGIVPHYAIASCASVSDKKPPTCNSHSLRYNPSGLATSSA